MWLSGEQVTYLRSRRLRQTIDLRHTEKPRYFAITEFNKCFIIRSPSLFLINKLMDWKRSAIFTHEWSQEGEKRGFIYAWAEYYLQPYTVGRHCAWADHYLSAVICRSRGGLSANEKEEKFASNDNNIWIECSEIRDKLQWQITTAWSCMPLNMIQRETER